MYIDSVIIAYLVDHFFGEFPLTHPVVYMGRFIQFFETHFYQPSIKRGAILVGSLLLICFLITALLEAIIYQFFPTPWAVVIIGILASTGIAMHMLYECVRAVVTADDPRHAISQLVSRDTANMSDSDVYKSALETWAENLSDGVVAPLFYLLLFGLKGIVIYKAINTLDSMIGYKTDRYFLFGRVAARLDDIANYIPARLTAVLLLLCLPWSKENWRGLWRDCHALESPNAGYPIAALAHGLQVCLGGNTVYHGKMKHKPTIGRGKSQLEANDVYRGLALRTYLDRWLLGILLVWILMMGAQG